MKSNRWRHVLMNRKASPRNAMQLSSPNVFKHRRMKAWWSRSSSTLTTCLQPRESSSKDMLPVPEKRSRAVASSKSISPVSTLNMFSLAKSVVGLALKERGISKCRPLYFPVITRTAKQIKSYKLNINSQKHSSTHTIPNTSLTNSNCQLSLLYPLPFR